ncbi:MAG: type II toxin-antitoxin system HicA family toxin [Spartobacteria bacterium]|nr:type II toxin-antitoxin system HicA family toxin [Spartobacteria bacterium]
MKQVTGKELAKAVTRKGWKLARTKGSHYVYVKDGHRERIVIPMHGSQPLKLGLLKSLMKIADISEEEI